MKNAQTSVDVAAIVVVVISRLLLVRFCQVNVDYSAKTVIKIKCAAVSLEELHKLGNTYWIQAVAESLDACICCLFAIMHVICTNVSSRST